MSDLQSLTSLRERRSCWRFPCVRFFQNRLRIYLHRKKPARRESLVGRLVRFNVTYPLPGNISRNLPVLDRTIRGFDGPRSWVGLPICDHVQGAWMLPSAGISRTLSLHCMKTAVPRCVLPLVFHGYSGLDLKITVSLPCNSMISNFPIP